MLATANIGGDIVATRQVADEPSSGCRPLCTADSPIERFEDWIRASGGIFNGVSLKSEALQERGVVTHRSIAADENLVAIIPRSCIITSQMGVDSPLGKQVWAQRNALPAFERNHFLACFLLDDMRNEASFFRPYYDVLPKDLHNMPVFWPDSVLEENLKGSAFLECVIRLNREHRDHYECMCKLVPEMERHSFEDYRRARMSCSRNYRLVIDGKLTTCLVPFADMFNHQVIQRL
jgi:histone-lysine N-methyltransferase SETD3